VDSLVVDANWTHFATQTVDDLIQRIHVVRASSAEVPPRWPEIDTFVEATRHDSVAQQHFVTDCVPESTTHHEHSTEPVFEKVVTKTNSLIQYTQIAIPQYHSFRLGRTGPEASPRRQIVAPHSVVVSLQHVLWLPSRQDCDDERDLLLLLLRLRHPPLQPSVLHDERDWN
jgi:hypothetical protein